MRAPSRSNDREAKKEDRAMHTATCAAMGIPNDLPFAIITFSPYYFLSFQEAVDVVYLSPPPPFIVTIATITISMSELLQLPCELQNVRDSLLPTFFGSVSLKLRLLLGMVWML